MMKSILLLSAILGSSMTHALEIDEKLTLRFLKVSNSKKTILINRGAEDGLAVGDHAKFFITSGVIARGVVEKVSPSRSIWSLYRVVDPAEITDNKVLNLKIASPVKITEDPSKSLKDEPIPGGSDKMDINAPAAGEEVPVLDDADKKELEGLGIEDETPAPKTKKKEKTAGSKRDTQEIVYDTHADGRVFQDRDWELWGTLNVNSLSGTHTNPSTDTSTDSSRSQMEGTLGVEKYFSTASSEFWRNFSAQLFGSLQSQETGSGGVTSTQTHTDIGAGASYHFFHAPNSINQFIGFGNISAGLGTNSLKTENATSSSDTKGSENFFSAGIGSKYYLSNGIGFRAMVDYTHRSEGLDIESAGETHTETDTLSGFRVQMGFSYRF